LQLQIAMSTSRARDYGRYYSPGMQYEKKKQKTKRKANSYPSQTRKLTAYFYVQSQEGDAAVAGKARNIQILTRPTCKVEGMVEQQPDSS